MQVFKFGGASIKDAAGVANLGQIVSTYKNDKLLIVVSAMDKITNLLEQLTHSYFRLQLDTFSLLEQVKKHHLDVLHLVGDDLLAAGGRDRLAAERRGGRAVERADGVEVGAVAQVGTLLELNSET